MDQQHMKERACHLGVKRGLSLFVRGHQVFGIRADGTMVIVCGGRQGVDLWPKALAILIREEELLAAAPSPFRVFTPSGVYEADSMASLIFRWFLRRERALPPPPEEGR
jgi:hypothetical protein